MHIGEDTALEIGHFRTFQTSTTLTDLGSGQKAYSHASLIHLYLHTKFHANWKNISWTKVVRMDIET